MRSAFAFVLSLSAAACTASTAPSAPSSDGTPAQVPTPGAPAAAPAAEASGPKLASVPCRFLAPKSVEGKTYSCFDLAVPENRRSADSKTIQLHVAVMKGKGGGVPTIELVGGPGGSSDPLVGGVAARETEMMTAYGHILEEGDLVLFDQRGTGRSVPRLSCAPEEAPNDCQKRLSAKGIDLAAYDTVENADDVHDLKLALGAAQVDLHGISYGTRLGIEVMKRHPEDVRAAILDGVMPSDMPMLGSFEVALNDVLTRVFTACAADPKCNTAYPNLDGTFAKLKAKLDKTPFKAEDPEYGPYDYDWHAFTAMLGERAYSEGFAARIPYMVHTMLEQTQEQWKAAQDADAKAVDAMYAELDKADAGNPLIAEYRKLQQNATDEDMAAAGAADGMYLSVTCNDYTQHESLAEARTRMATMRPELKDDQMLEGEALSCSGWPTRTSDPGLSAPPTFTGPVLVIGGALNPATPYTWAQRVSGTLPNDQFVLVPTGGHGLMDACGGTLKGSFLADPTRPLDTTCATQRSISFYYPTASSPGRAGRALARVMPQLLLPPAKTPMAKIADRVLAGAHPALGLANERDRRRALLHHR